MCKPGDNGYDIEQEAATMTDREGIVERRVTRDDGSIDFGRWLRDTLRMWPLIVVLVAVGWRSELTRSTVLDIEEDFISEGPRVSTEKDRPTTIEAELKMFKSELRIDYMPREVLDLKLTQILKDGSETNTVVKELRKAVMELQRQRGGG